MADLEISNLPPLSGAALAPIDVVPLTDVSASETKKITAKELVQSGIALIDVGSIPSDKLNYNLPPGVIDTIEIADAAITAAKLADNSSASVSAVAPASPFIGQAWIESGTNLLRIWNGSIWSEVKAAGSVNTSFGDAETYNIEVTASILTADLTLPSGTVVPAKTLYVSAQHSDATLARQFLAGPTGGPGAITARQIVGTDLPPATTSTLGAVIVNGDGLRMSAGDIIQIDNDITPSIDYGVVQYDAKGLVLDGRKIQSIDLPPATAGEIGAVLPGSGLNVAANGKINHINSVVASIAAKVAYDTEGHITQALSLEPADIPNLDASILTEGTLDPARIADGSINNLQLADYAISYIQEAEPPVTDPGSIGMLWMQESTAQLRMWNGNSWFAVGLGRLVQENLRWGGLIDASTGLVTAVTRFGLAAGLAVGTPLPDARDQLGGLYVVISVGGNNIGQTPGITYDEGDWCLCIDQANGWERIDTLSGGGSGGADRLDDLLDVTITNPRTSQVIVFDELTAQWLNEYPFLDGLFDVVLTAPADGDILQYDAGTLKWINTPLGLATETTAGIAEIATQVETDAGVDDQRFITPLKLDTRRATEVLAGIAEIATQIETDDGLDDTRIVTPLKLSTYVSQNLWIDGGSAVSNFGSAPAEIDGGVAA